MTETLTPQRELIDRAEKLLAECGENRPRYLDDWANDSVRLQLLLKEFVADARTKEGA